MGAAGIPAENDGDEMRVLLVSNGPSSATGYGQQAALFCPRIRKARHEVVIFAFTAQGSPTTTPDGFLQLPRVAHPFGNDIVVEHFRQSRAQVAISLIDPFALDPEKYSQFPWCSWAPIDSDPIFPGNAHALQSARWIWAMSRFGEKALKDVGLGEKTSYVPHGVDSQVFIPQNRDVARRTIEQATGAKLAGRFLVVMVAANKSNPARKGFFEAFSAFKAFSDSHPEAVLYVHSETSHAFNGEELPAIVDLVKLSRDKVIWVPQYPYLTGSIPPSFLANVYSAADVFFSASHTEGFNIPLVEAQLCGCPVIVPNNSAQAELCLVGELVECTDYMSLGHVVWKRPKVDALVAALEWSHRQQGPDIRAKARERALAYGADTVFSSYMLPALKKIERDLA